MDNSSKKAKINPILIMKATKDLKKFLASHQIDYPQSDDIKDLYIKVTDKVFVFNLDDKSMREKESLPSSCYLIEIEPEALEQIASKLGITYDLNCDFFKKVFKKLKTKDSVNGYKEFLEIAEGSVKTNVKFSNLVKIVGKEVL